MTLSFLALPLVAGWHATPEIHKNPDFMNGYLEYLLIISLIVRQPSSSIWPRTQNLISLLKGGHSAYFTIEYQFSIYIIEVFAKKLHFKMLPHTEYSFSKFGSLADFGHILKSNCNA